MEYDLLCNVLFIAFIILLFYGAIHFKYILQAVLDYKSYGSCYMNDNKKTRCIKKEIFFRIFLFLIIVFLILFVYVVMNHCEDEREQLIRAEYTGFYNDEEIDLNNIDFSNYDVKYNHEEKTVYLSEKTEYRYLFIPIRF